MATPVEVQNAYAPVHAVHAVVDDDHDEPRSPRRTAKLAALIHTDQGRCSISVLAGNSYPDTAARLDLTRREVELIVRSIEESFQLRRLAASPD